MEDDAAQERRLLRGEAPRHAGLARTWHVAGERIAIRQVGVGDGEAAGKTLFDDGCKGGQPGFVEAAAQAVLKGRREQGRPAAGRLLARGLAALAPEPLIEDEAVRAVRRGLHGVGRVGPEVDGEAVEIALLVAQQAGDLGVGVGLVPQLAGEDGRGVLVAGGAQGARGVEHARLAARPVVAHQLELEAPGRLVVADHFEDRRRLLIADVKPILEQRHVRPGRLAGIPHDCQDGAGSVEETRGRRVALQRPAERDEHPLDGREVRDGADEVGEGERDVVDPLAAALDGDQRIEERPPGRRQVLAWVFGVDRPGRGSSGSRRRGGERRQDEERREGQEMKRAGDAPPARVAAVRKHRRQWTSATCWDSGLSLPFQQSSAVLPALAAASL